jgi:hypothetical protein
VNPVNWRVAIEVAIEGLKPRGAEAVAVGGCKVDSDMDCEKSKAGDCKGPMEAGAPGFRSISNVADIGECEAEAFAGRWFCSCIVYIDSGQVVWWKDAR